MAERDNLSFFLDPKSVAVLGASDRDGSWGNIISWGIVTLSYPGSLCPT